MADVTIERNLLFGVIAYRDRLISLKDFGKACVLWSLEMNVPLADLLIEEGWITVEGRRDGERTLEWIVKQHQGDVRGCLGEVADADVRDAIRAIPEIRKPLRDLPPAAGFVQVDAPTRVLPNRDDQLRYTKVEDLLGGSLGQVYRALDKVMLREVAVKEIPTEQVGRPGVGPRLLKEALITGQLEHPNIVPVYEMARRIGDNSPFYVMRFVRGPTLGAAIAAFHEQRRQGRLDPREQLRLRNAFVTICQAIGYAHSRGIVHRDLKPANVMLGAFGQVIVLDWGLAKMVDRLDDDAPEVTLSAEAVTPATTGLIGTLNYMAPEQAEGRHDIIDSRTDIFGLGAILFEILTGRPPFVGNTDYEILSKVISGEAPRARTLEPTVPHRLDEICAKALSKDRDKRYARATDLAEAVQGWIADEPRVAVAMARVDALATAEVREVPGIIRELEIGLRALDDAGQIRDRLREMARSGATEPHGDRRRIHAALALLADDAGQADTLVDRLLQAETRPDELIVIRQALQDQHLAEPRTPALWAALETIARELTDAQFRAAGALASFAPSDPRWSDLVCRQSSFDR